MLRWYVAIVWQGLDEDSNIYLHEDDREKGYFQLPVRPSRFMLQKPG